MYFTCVQTTALLYSPSTHIPHRERIGFIMAEVDIMAKNKNTLRAQMLALVRSALLGCVISVALVAAVSTLMWKQAAGVELIPLFVAIIKVISGAAAGLFAKGHTLGRAWLMGGAAGLLYSVTAYVLSMLLGGKFGLNAALLSDVGIGVLSGMLSAMLARAIG